MHNALLLDTSRAFFAPRHDEHIKSDVQGVVGILFETQQNLKGWYTNTDLVTSIGELLIV